MNKDWTNISTMRIKDVNSDKKGFGFDASQPVWGTEKTQNEHGSFMKNMAVAAALILCAVALRTGTILPLNKETDVVLAAMTDQSLLDENLGKLSFVSSLFPEAVSVFSRNAIQEFVNPADDGYITHAWSEMEPYVAWNVSKNEVISACNGEVSGVYHGNGEEKIVSILHESGLSLEYGNLMEVCVQIGDWVHQGDVIGRLDSDCEVYMELKQNGISIDPFDFIVR